MGRFFGHVEHVPIGTEFSDRRALAAAAIHRPIQAGISGSQSEGADSVVLSAGYEDDEDFGGTVIYTGHGGRDPITRRQIADQKLTHQNLALARNVASGLPIRLVRGPNPASLFAPKSGYRYDGLYRVVDAWTDRGKSGFLVWRFRLESLNSTSPAIGPGEQEQMPPPRIPQTVQRIVRDTELSRRVKELHDFTCQVCGVRLGGPAGPYAEAAHIRPLGEPHNGPDVLGNILCLCPNHHVLFDIGAFTIADDLSLVGERGNLRTIPQHSIRIEFTQYHREHYGTR